MKKQTKNTTSPLIDTIKKLVLTYIQENIPIQKTKDILINLDNGYYSQKKYKPLENYQITELHQKVTEMAFINSKFDTYENNKQEYSDILNTLIFGFEKEYINYDTVEDDLK